MRARRGRGWWVVGACVLALAGGCGPGTAERASPPVSEGVAAAAPVEPAAAPVPAANSVTAIVRAFARGETVEVVGQGSLRQWLATLAPRLAGDGAVELVFVVDRSLPDQAARALALALAGARPGLPADARTGLVSFAARGGAWVTRVEAPLAADTHATVRAAGRVAWVPDGGAGVAGGWAGLAEAAHMAWSAPAGRRHVVLLLDEREGDAVRMEARPADDPAQRSSVAAWAREAAVHVVLCRLELADGRGDGPEAPPDPGVPLAVVAGLVRDGRHARVESSEALVAAISGGLEELADGPADVALVVDRAGIMGESLASLAALRPAIDRFVATPGHRVALLGWDGRVVDAVAGLSDRSDVVAGALKKLRAGPRGDRPRPLFTAVAAAQGLGWSPAARKRVIVLTAAPARVDAAADAALAWTDTAAVTVQIVEPAPGLTSAGRAP